LTFLVKLGYCQKMSDKKHYVYAILDPRPDTFGPFYIGKGSSARRFQHFKRAPIDARKNPAKVKRFEEIEAAGFKPQAVVLSWHETQKEAYAEEKVTIEKFGLENLTNQNVGGAGGLKPGTKRLDDEEVKTKALTPKQEKFAQLVASGVNQSDAYREAYDASKMQANSIHVNSAKLVADTKIALRIAELRKPAVEQIGLTVEKLIHELEEAQALAKETDQPNAMTNAIMAKAKLGDLIPASKSENLNVNVTQLEERLKEGRDNVVRLRTCRDPADLRETLLALEEADGSVK